MLKRDIIVVGASAGGVNALIDLVKALPENLDASVFIVLHIAPFSKSILPELLARKTKLDVGYARDGEKIKKGSVYIAPPDHHLLIEKDHIAVKKGPKENRFRPAIDALFRSAAYVYGSRVIGIVLSGMLNDGTSGMWSVKRLGGYALIQDPNDASFPDMPTNVMEFVEVDELLEVGEMAPRLVELVGEKAPATPEITAAEMKLLKAEVSIAKKNNAFEMGILEMGKLTPFTCPECHGALVSVDEGKQVRFRCHTGHAFTASALLAGVTTTVEEMLWNSIRGLEETIMLLEKIAENFEKAGDKDSAKQFLQKADETRKRAQGLHSIVFTQELMSEDMRHDKDR